MNPLSRFARWLHTGWPAGTVEALPEVGRDGATAWPEVRIVGDLTGVPLLKLAIDSGARAAEAIVTELGARRDDALDLAIVGAGPAGLAAAIVAKQAGLRYVLLEAARPLASLENFPRHKPIYTLPDALVPHGALQITAEVKEALLEELHAQAAAHAIVTTPARVTRLSRRDGRVVVEREGGAPIVARRVIVAIGRTGDFRQLGVSGEALPHVSHRLFDARDHAGQRAVVIGGGDSAVETAIALAEAGATVTLVHRGAELVRPKAGNVERLGAQGDRITVRLGARVEAIDAHTVKLLDHPEPIPADVVFVMIGREAPLDFFRRSGLPIAGQWRARTVLAFAGCFLLCAFVYTWKSGGALTQLFAARGWFPFGLGGFAPTPLGKTLHATLRQPGFYYSLAYTVAVAAFGVARVRRTPTPYVRWQTLALAAIQIVPLFLIPYFVLPYLGHAGLFDGGALGHAADQLFPRCGYDHGREYWRAFGFVLAWPLFIWNFFSPQPLGWWLAIGLAQTFVVIPLIVWRWGKGAYCGWICSCGALAETLGDRQRHKMPHGPRWNRLNLLGQGILAIVALLFVARVVSWYAPGGLASAFYDRVLSHGSGLDYYHVVDLFLAGVVGVSFYFWFSGRVWCRFACPLAALMHLYARFSRFRIFADKPRCISCNVCTSVCHQGIDVMAFAQRGAPMVDPQCVRCSACVSSCPTETLAFGRQTAAGPVLDRLSARPVRRLPIVR